MTEKEFEDLFRKKLENYSSQVPENMWQKVKPEEKKERKFFWWWSFSGGILLITALAGGYFLLRTNKNDDNKNISIYDKSSASEKIFENAIKEKKKKEPILKEKQGTEFFELNNKKAASENYLNNKHDSKTNTSAKNILIKNSINLSNREEDNFKNQKVISAATQSPQMFQKRDSSESVINNNEQNKFSTSINSDTRDKKIESKLLIQPDSSIKKTITKKTTSSKKESTQLIPKVNNCFAEIYASPDLPNNKITPADMSLAFYPQLSYTIGLKAGKYFNNHISVITGLQYSQVTEYTNSDSNLTKYPVKYKSIDIPLLFGYSINRKHFNAGVNAGLIFNAHSFYTGQLSIYNIYKTNTGFSLYLGLNYQLALTHKIFLFAEPYFKYPLSNMVNNNIFLTQKINIAGLSLGFKYNFLKRRQQK